MRDHSKLNLLNFLIFVSLIHWIRGEIKDLKEVTAGTVSDNNDSATDITRNTSVEQILNKQFKSYELSVKKAAEAEDKLLRRTRDIEPVSKYNKYLESRVISTTTTNVAPYIASTLDCYYCSADSASPIRDPCYEGGQ